ncbi:MAG TPA: hypothetical protein VGO92_09360, partial [Acidimicrobiales bacterium]|nr:hypothetical protein [Acidimicrobiales bacterium]
MTTVLIERQAPNRLLTDDEVDELCALTAHLPLLLRGGWTTPTPLGLSEGALRLDAAMWEVAYRHGVDVGATCNVLDVVDKLSA